MCIIEVIADHLQKSLPEAKIGIFGSDLYGNKCIRIMLNKSTPLWMFLRDGVIGFVGVTDQKIVLADPSIDMFVVIVDIVQRALNEKTNGI